MSGLLTNGLPAAAFPLTGSELLPADTQLANGVTPQSESVSVKQVKGYYRPTSALTDAATIATDASLAEIFSVTLGGNRTLANPTNLQDGQQIDFVITQDGTGNRTLAYGNLFKFSGSSTISTTAGRVDRIACRYVGGVLLCALATNFA